MFKMLKFWTVAFAYAMWQTVRRRDWHMIFIDFETGVTPEGHTARKRLTARRTCGGAEISWS